MLTYCGHKGSAINGLYSGRLMTCFHYSSNAVVRKLNTEIIVHISFLVPVCNCYYSFAPFKSNEHAYSYESTSVH